MLPRPASSANANANICLSCQLRLLRRISTSASSVFTSTGTYPRRRPLDRDQNFQRRKISTSQPTRLKIRYVAALERREGVWDKAELLGRTIQQGLGEPRTVKLKIDSLGASTEPILLEGDQGWVPNHGPLQRAPSLRQPDQEMGILAAIKAETGLIQQSEVDANIEEQRPKDSHVPLSGEQFQQIRKTLEDGYTNTQLEQYITAYKLREPKEKQAEGVEEHRKAKSGSPGNGVVSVTDWFAERTDEDRMFVQNHLRGYATIQHNRKQKLVLKILRSCWKIHAREVVESIGELELHINEPEFNLLTNSSISPLEPITAMLHHQDGEKIEAFRSRSVLRITANRRRAIRIAHEIHDNIMGRIQKITIKISTLKALRAVPKTSRVDEGEKSTKKSSEDENTPKQPIDRSTADELLKEVSKMTGTSIYGTRNLVTIFGINESENPNSASRAEIATRLIIAYYLKFNKEPPLLGLRPCLPTATEALVRCDDLACLPWYDRLKHWMRRTTATSKSTNRSNAADSIMNRIFSTPRDTDQFTADETTEFSPNDLESSDKASETLAKAVARNPRKNEGSASAKIWQETYQTRSDVILGQVLHERPGAMPIEMLYDRENLSISDTQTFSTTVPNLPTLMENLRVDDQGMTPQMSESVEIQFEPSPLSSDGLRISKAFPAVSLRFRIDEVDNMTRILRLKGIKAIVRTKISDVMLPDRPVDLRFQQRTTSDVPNIFGKSHDASNAVFALRISKFLAASELNLLSGIKTPSTIILPMERHLCKERAAWKEAKISSHNTMDVEYMFSGMKVKKQMQFDFRGWTLIYTDVSAGKAGGRQREVRLCPRPSGSRPVGGEEDFVRAAFELADVVGGHKGVYWSAPEMSNIKWQSTGVADDKRYFSEKVVPEDPVQMEVQTNIQTETEEELP